MDTTERYLTNCIRFLFSADSGKTIYRESRNPVKNVIGKTSKKAAMYGLIEMK